MSSTETEPTDDEIDALVADALAKKGELVPTTVSEVGAAEDLGVSFEGELPDSLLEPPGAGPAVSHRLVSLDEARKQREAKRASRLTPIATFVAGAAVAAGVMFVVRPSGPAVTGPDQGAGPTPTASAPAAPTAEPVSIPAVRTCGAECCAGAACADAKGELRACASGRSCVGCDPPGPATAYQVRFASLVATDVLADVDLGALDLCGRVLGGAWSCVPAYAAPSAEAPSRTLSRLATAADLAYGLEIELRPRGTKTVMGRWRDSVRVGPTVLCRGLGALVKNDKDENVGSLAIVLDDPYYVEIARAAEVAPLRSRRALLAFADVAPFVVETKAEADRKFALAAGPFDQATAERLRWLLVEQRIDVKTTLGADFTGAPMMLP